MIANTLHRFSFDTKLFHGRPSYSGSYFLMASSKTSPSGSAEYLKPRSGQSQNPIVLQENTRAWYALKAPMHSRVVILSQPSMIAAGLVGLSVAMLRKCFRPLTLRYLTRRCNQKIRRVSFGPYSPFDNLSCGNSLEIYSISLSSMIRLELVRTPPPSDNIKLTSYL